MSSILEIKQGDEARIRLTTVVDLSQYTKLTFRMKLLNEEMLTKDVSIPPSTQLFVDITLSSAFTSEEGEYKCELLGEPGPHTYPSIGYCILVIKPTVAQLP